MTVNNKVNITIDAKDKASSKLSWLWSRLKWLWWPLKALWIAAAASTAVVASAWIKLFNIADEIETTVWKSKIVFWEYFDEMNTFAETTWKAMWLTRTEFLKTASWMQDLLIPMWFTREEAKNMTQDTMWLAWALSEWSAWQYTATEAWDILTKAMLGETEQLKSMWISISTWSDEFKNLQASIMESTWATEQQWKALAIQQLIMEKSTDAQAAYAWWADSLTRKKAEMWATLRGLQQTIAESLLPAFHEIVKVMKPIIEKVATSIWLWFKNKQNVEKLTTTFKVIIKVFSVIFQVIWKAIWFLTKMWEMLWFVAFKVVEFVWVVKEKFNAMSTSISQVWNSIKSTTMNIWEWVKSYFIWVLEFFKNIFSWAFNFIQSSIWNKLQAISSLMSWIWSWISSMTSWVWTWIRNVVVWLVDSLYSWVVWKFDAMINKVSSIYNKIKGWLWSIFWAESKANASASRIRATNNAVASYSTPTYWYSWARASWWDVIAWKTYLVWEKWVESFTPTQNWRINSNGSTGAWINVTFWDVNLNNWQDEQQFFEKVKRTMIEVQRTSNLWF